MALNKHSSYLFSFAFMAFHSFPTVGKHSGYDVEIERFWGTPKIHFKIYPVSFPCGLYWNRNWYIQPMGKSKMAAQWYRPIGRSMYKLAGIIRWLNVSASSITCTNSWDWRDALIAKCQSVLPDILILASVMVDQSLGNWLTMEPYWNTRDWCYMYIILKH